VLVADEAGIRPDHHAGTTWAPVGRTPVLATTGARHAINMISAVTARGALWFMVFEGRFTAAVVIEFCTRLLHDAPGPVFLIVDGHSAHRARAVGDCVAGIEGRLRLVFLPGYSPELDPDEWVGTNVEHDRIGRAGITGRADREARAIGALRRLPKLPRIVRGRVQAR
jgi:hypothetical protein